MEGHQITEEAAVDTTTSLLARDYETLIALLRSSLKLPSPSLSEEADEEMKESEEREEERVRKEKRKVKGSSSSPSSALFPLPSLMASLKALHSQVVASIEQQKHSLMTLDKPLMDRANVEWQSFAYEETLLTERIQAEREATCPLYERIEPSLNLAEEFTLRGQRERMKGDESDAEKVREEDESVQKMRVAALQRELEQRNLLLQQQNELQEEEKRLNAQLTQDKESYTQLQTKLKSVADVLVSIEDPLFAQVRANITLPMLFQSAISALPTPLYTLYIALSAHQTVFQDDLKLAIHMEATPSISFTITSNTGKAAVNLVVNYDVQWLDVCVQAKCSYDSNVSSSSTSVSMEKALHTWSFLNLLYAGDDGHVLPCPAQFASVSPNVAVTSNNTALSSLLSFYWLKRICGIQTPHTDQQHQATLAHVTVSDVLYRIKQRLDARALVLDLCMRLGLTLEEAPSGQLPLTLMLTGDSQLHLHSHNHPVTIKCALAVDYPWQAPLVRLLPGATSVHSHAAALLGIASEANSLLTSFQDHTILERQMQLIHQRLKG